MTRMRVLVTMAFAMAVLAASADAKNISGAYNGAPGADYTVTLVGGDPSFNDFEIAIDPFDGLAQYELGALPSGWGNPSIVTHDGRMFLRLTGPSLTAPGTYLFDIHYLGAKPQKSIVATLTQNGTVIHSQCSVGWAASVLCSAGAVPGLTPGGVALVILLLMGVGTIALMRRANNGRNLA